MHRIPWSLPYTPDASSYTLTRGATLSYTRTARGLDVEATPKPKRPLIYISRIYEPRSARNRALEPQLRPEPRRPPSETPSPKPGPARNAPLSHALASSPADHASNPSQV